MHSKAIRSVTSSKLPLLSYTASISTSIRASGVGLSLVIQNNLPISASGFQMRHYITHAEYASDEYYKALPRYPLKLSRDPTSIFMITCKVVGIEVIKAPFGLFFHLLCPNIMAKKIKNKNPLSLTVTLSEVTKLKQITEDIRKNHTSLPSVLLHEENGASLKGFSFGSPWNSHMGLSTHFFYSQSTLPQELSIDLVKKGVITEEKWIKIYDDWCIKNYVDVSNPSYTSKMERLYDSQYTIDARRYYHRCLLAWYKDDEMYDNVRRFIIGHELSHLHHYDPIKLNFLSIFSYFLAVSTLNSFVIPLIPWSILTLYISRLAETRCDKWSAQLDNRSLRGGIKYFEEAEKNKELFFTKYPELNNPSLRRMYQLISTHPSHKERLEKLRTYSPRL